MLSTVLKIIEKQNCVHKEHAFNYRIFEMEHIWVCEWHLYADCAPTHIIIQFWHSKRR